MELFLWLYFYDNRWLLNIKVPVKIYKYIWFLPIFMHSILISVGIYYLHFSDNFRCVNSLKLWLYHRILFSFLMCLNMIVFMVKITHAYEKETSYFEKAKKVYPILSNSIHEYDYWIRRNSLFSTSGVLLLFQGLISFFWSYMIAALYKDHYYDSCDLRLQQVLNLHSISIWYGNILLLFIFVIMTLTKLFFGLLGSFYPGTIIRLSRLLHSKRTNLKTYFHSRLPEDTGHSKKLEVTF